MPLEVLRLKKKELYSPNVPFYWPPKHNADVNKSARGFERKLPDSDEPTWVVLSM